MTVPVFLAPGTVYCSANPVVVNTILGSCVAVCLWDRVCGAGGMNHFLLPRRGAGARSPRFGDVAIERLLDAMRELGCKPASLHAKLFGGAAVLPFGPHAETVGTLNVEVALAELQRHGIPVVARHTGGRRGLFIRLYTQTGHVLVRELCQAPR